MITTGLINISYYVLNWLISLFPVGSNLPTNVHTGASYLGGFFTLINPLVPTTTLAIIIGLIFTVEIAFFGWRTLKWVLSFIPLIGGRG